jgi:acetoin utilization deacetylase AcuC-like enzyme
MHKVGLVYDPIYAEHDTGFTHPEKADRVIQAFQSLKDHHMAGENRSSTFIPIIPRVATFEQISTMHSNAFISRVKSSVEKARQIGDLIYLDGDTPVCEKSYDASLKATGGNLAAIDSILAGEVERSFVLCRPPGHHSNQDLARGFCLFNNIAIATNYLLREKKLKKVAIVDFDCHAGNGTEDMLYSGLPEGEVLFISTHQDPHTLYPFECFLEEIGEGKQKGKIMNITFAPLSGDRSMQLAIQRIIAPVLREFKPEFILMSAGFDAHKNDPLTRMGWTEQGFGKIMQSLVPVAEEVAHGRINLTLEGGYNIGALCNSIVNVMSVLSGGTILETEDEYEEPSNVLEYTENQLIPSIKSIFQPFYKCFQ